MKKLIAIAACALCIATATHAQVDTRRFVFALTPEASFPIGKFRETNKLGAGGNFVGQFYLAEKLRALTSIGGILYQPKEYSPFPDYTDEYPVVALLSFRGGIKYYIADAIFIAGNAGIDHVRQDGESKIGFAYTPMFGTELGGVDLYVKYNANTVKTITNSSIQTVGICIGYRF